MSEETTNLNTGEEMKCAPEDPAPVGDVKKEPREPVDDDEDMPEPKTKSYEQYLVLKPLFMTLLNNAFGKMPYNSAFRNGDKQVKLSDIFKLCEEHTNHMAIADMNMIISYIASAPFSLVRELMMKVEDPQKQTDLWTVMTD